MQRVWSVSLMSHPNTTIAQHMRQVMLDAGQSTIMRADIVGCLMLNECARRCAHTNLMSVRRTEQPAAYSRRWSCHRCSSRTSDEGRQDGGWSIGYWKQRRQNNCTGANLVMM